MESLSKKFFPESLSPAEVEKKDLENGALMKTIRMSKNLFSLTERLPKNKYRGRSNDINEMIRQNSAESQVQLLANANSGSTFKLKNMAANEGSPDSKNSIKRGKSFEESPTTLPQVAEADNHHRSISKPRHVKRGSEVVELKNRSPSYNKQLPSKGLSGSPSMLNVATMGHNSNRSAKSDGNLEGDDQMPAKPQIGDAAGGGELINDFSELPMLA